jgi:hypothetical protein
VSGRNFRSTACRRRIFSLRATDTGRGLERISAAWQRHAVAKRISSGLLFEYLKELMFSPGIVRHLGPSNDFWAVEKQKCLTTSMRGAITVDVLAELTQALVESALTVGPTDVDDRLIRQPE